MVPTLFEKYAKRPANWKQAQKLFKRISLKLHPDKNHGTGKETYQALVAELEEWQFFFAAGGATNPFLYMQTWFTAAEKEERRTQKETRSEEQKEEKRKSAALKKEAQRKAQKAQRDQVEARKKKANNGKQDDEKRTEMRAEMKAQMKAEFEQILKEAAEEARTASALFEAENKRLLSELHATAAREQCLREEATKLRRQHRDQMRELEEQIEASLQREAVMGSDHPIGPPPCEADLPFALSLKKTVSFRKHSLAAQIKKFVKQGQRLYTFLDGVTMDPDSYTFSLNDALFQAFNLEPNFDDDPDGASQRARRATKTINTRLNRSGRKGVVRLKSGTFLPYPEICRELIRLKDLTVIPGVIIDMSVHVLAPSPTFILALMCQLRQIAEGKVNVTIVRAVLGAKGTKEFDSYMKMVKDWNARNQLCQSQVCKGKGKGNICGKRVNINKTDCSYHLAKKSKKRRKQ